MMFSNQLCAQNEGVPHADHSAIELAHKEYDRTLPQFDNNLHKITDKIYILTGLAIQSGWLTDTSVTLEYSLKAGYQFTPIHQGEFGLNYFDTISTAGAKREGNFGLEAAYGFNLSNFGSRTIQTSRYEFLFLAGLSTQFNSPYLSFFAGLRANFEVLPNVNVFIEPRISTSLISSTGAGNLTSSLSLGLSITLHKPEFYIHEVLTPLAVKTNLLYNAIGAFNIGVEAPILGRYSVVLEGAFPWYSNAKNHTYYRVYNINAEGRYWFKKSERGDEINLLTGWFAGVFFGGGGYDLMYQKSQGVQGGFYMGGVTGGYTHHLKHNLRMEYAIGLGMTQSTFYKYKWDGFDYALIAPRSITWRTFMFVPKASISLVWMLNFKSDK